MQGSIFDRPSFRPQALLIQLALAALIFCSWAYIDATRVFWDQVDAWVFYTLNGSLDGAPRWWHMLWAFGNSRSCDIVSAVLLLAILVKFMLAEDGQYLTERAAVGIYIGLALGIAAGVGETLVTAPRESASLVLKPVHYLSDLVPEIKAKDRSGNSFPGDHATVLWMVSIIFWQLAGRRYGLMALGVASLFMLPRVVAGAHWFTDITAGALTLSLVVTAILLYTPILHLGLKLLTKLLSHPIPQALLTIIPDKEAPKLMGKGCCMGAADIVPGVSGGTVAYILGIWHRLIEAIKSFDLAWFKLLASFKITEALHKAHLHFLIPLFGGIVLAVIFFTKIIPVPYLITHHPEPVYGLFFGLIGGSILLLLKQIGKLDAKDGLTLIIGAVLGWLLVTLVPVETPTAAWFIFFSGVVAISAMLLPGISGSFILLILGKYAYVLGGLGEMNFSIIIPFVAGCAVGIMSFARIASWLLHRFYRITTLIITGILTGSLWMIWPFQNRVYEIVREKSRLISSSPMLPESFGNEQILAILLALIGFGVVWLLEKKAHHMQEKDAA